MEAIDHQCRSYPVLEDDVRLVSVASKINDRELESNGIELYQERILASNRAGRLA
jgi:hypothetical protein